MLTKICLLFSFIFITSIYAMELESTHDSDFVSPAKENKIYLPHDISKNLYIYFIQIYLKSHPASLQHPRSLKFLLRYILATCSSRKEINTKLVESLAALIQLACTSSGKSPLEEIEEIRWNKNLNADILDECFKEFAQTKLCESKYPLLRNYLLFNEPFPEDCYLDPWGNEKCGYKVNKRRLEMGLHLDFCSIVDANIDCNRFEFVKLLLEYKYYFYILVAPSSNHLDPLLVDEEYEKKQLIKTEAIKFFYPLNSVEEIVKYRMDEWGEHPIDTLYDLYPLFGKDLFGVLRNLDKFKDLPEELKIAVEKENLNEFIKALRITSLKLIDAMEKKDFEFIKYLVNLAIKTIFKMVLFEIMSSSSFDSVKIIIENFKKVDNDWLKEALKAGNMNVLKLVLSRPEIIDTCRAEDVRGAFKDWYNQISNVEEIIELIKAGVNWQKAFDTESAILHYMDYYSESEFNRLLPYVIDVFKKLINRKYENGETALITFCRSGDAKKWKYDLLMKLGSDITLKNDDGCTALDLVIRDRLKED